MIGTWRIRGQACGHNCNRSARLRTGFAFDPVMRSKPLSTAGLGVEWQMQQDGRNPDGLHQQSSHRTKNFRSLKRYGHHSADGLRDSPSVGSLMDLHFIRILKVSSASSIPALLSEGKCKPRTSLFRAIR